jgi:hypothetical protein
LTNIEMSSYMSGRSTGKAQQSPVLVNIHVNVTVPRAIKQAFGYVYEHVHVSTATGRPFVDFASLG